MNRALVIIKILEEAKPRVSIYPQHLESWDKLFGDLREHFAPDEEFLEKRDMPPEVAANTLLVIQNSPEQTRCLFDISELPNGILRVKIKASTAGALTGVWMMLLIFKEGASWIDHGLAATEGRTIEETYLSLMKMALLGFDFLAS
jgi:hypothetical protein